ncbi:low-density lipoprotein receptor-related protein 4-like [Patiria miniata]|uniref:EGF-like domain-containing protein n=1 Tax=Patiria miniata TaxID=46514 RepID=A0A913ZJ24_PATMI|nr:low-density lipoprotein receptor-related protein 4-like [Patiria miniata]
MDDRRLLRSLQVAVIILCWFAPSYDCQIATSEPYDWVFVANLDPPAIFKAPADTFEFTAIPNLEDDLSRPVAIDYDPVDGMVYWTDVTRSTISRASVDGTDVLVLVSDLRSPVGLCLDVVNRKMYWTDEDSYLIEKATMDGLHRSVVINLSAYEDRKPRAIVVDTRSSHLYWTIWGSAPMIERADVNGGSRKVIVDTDLNLPNGLALDTSSSDGRLYWCDARLERIESVDLDGGSRQVHANIDGIVPFDIWFYRGDVYWSDWRYLKLVHMQFSPVRAALIGSLSFQKAGGLHIHKDTSLDHTCVDSTPCGGGERCRQFRSNHQCVCKDGLAGVFCQKDNPCSDTSCFNGGVCLQSSRMTGGFFCQCSERYTGTYCERFVHICRSNPCLNGGICVDEQPSESFRCECTVGFIGETCDRKSNPYDLAFVANLDPPGIFVAPTDTFNFTLIPGLEDDLSRPVAIDYDPVDGMVYWTDVQRKSISRALLDGTGVTVLVTGLLIPDGLGLDVDNRVMYWTDDGTDLIERATMDGKDRAVVINLRNESIDEVKPRAIVVDTIHNHLYWTDWGSYPKIERANTDGSSRIVLVDTGLQHPNGVALDFDGGRMYWCDAALDLIESTDLLGDDRRVHADLNTDKIHPFDIWFYRGRVYWTDWRFKRILRIVFEPKTEVTFFGSINFLRAGGLHIYTDHSTGHECNDPATCQEGERCRQYKTTHECVCKDGLAGAACELDNLCASSPCENGGTCSRSASRDDDFFCQCPNRYSGKRCETFVPPCDSSPCMHAGTCLDELPDSFHCECSPGYVGTQCEDESKPYDLAFVANLSPPGIYVAPTDTFNFTLIPDLDDKLGRPVAIDYDPVDGTVYWTDVRQGTISRAFLDGTGVLILVSGLKGPDGLSLDSENRVMYWTDGGSDLIEKATMDGQERSVILNLTDHSVQEVLPRAILVDSTHGHLYWTELGSSPKIERANTDGTSRQVLVDTGLKWPSGLALDMEGGRMYWCDAGLDQIESTDLLGDDRSVHAELATSKIHPFDIWFYRGRVYWTDWRFTQILRMDFLPGDEVHGYGSETFARAGGLHIHSDGFSDHTCLDSTPCGDGERCRQFQGHHQCVCKDGLAGASCKLANPCGASSCSLSGTCYRSASANDGYFCQCLDRYSGTDCENYEKPNQLNIQLPPLGENDKVGNDS